MQDKPAKSEARVILTSKTVFLLKGDDWVVFGHGTPSCSYKATAEVYKRKHWDDNANPRPIAIREVVVHESAIEYKIMNFDGFDSPPERATATID